MRLFFKRSSGSGQPPSIFGTSTAELPLAEEPRSDSAKAQTLTLDPPADEGKVDSAPASSSASSQETSIALPPPRTRAFSDLDFAATPKQELLDARDLPSAADTLAALFSEAPPPEITAQAAAEHPAQAVLEEADISVEPAAPIVKPASSSLLQVTAPAAIEPMPSPVSKSAHDPSPELSFEEIQLAPIAAPVVASPASTNGELNPEDAATVLAAASAELSEEMKSVSDALANDAAESAAPEPTSAAAILGHLPGPSRDWAFEEILAAHREWVESKGAHGKKADLPNANLEGVELINVNLRLADLHYANLKSADLLLADLRDACLVRADLEEACLVGANLEGANLEGASLETSLGLVPRQLAGANLREATLPAQISGFPALNVFRSASRTAVYFFAAIMAISALSALAIWRTKDIQLVTDSAILPFLHSAKAAAAMPSAQIFLITPVALFLLYLAFVAQVQRVWGAALELPAVFPDGSSLGDKEQSIIVGLLRAQFRWMNCEAGQQSIHGAPAGRTLEATISLLLAYWTVPIMLFLFWARYLTLQELHGTILHEALASVSAGVALHATFKLGRPQEKWALQRNFASRLAENMRESRPPVLVAALLVITTFFSFGTIRGIPHDVSRAPQYGPVNFRRWAPTALWTVGFDPFADLTEAQISTPRANWDWRDETVATGVRGVHLNEPRFRYAQAYGAFFANGHLWHADFRGAYLSNADFRNADLTQSNFQGAIMDSARMNHANLDRSVLQGGHFARTDFRDANLSYASLADSFLMDASFDRASLYNSLLSHANLVRASFSRTDLRNAHIEYANLEHAQFANTYLWSASLQNSDLKDADFGSAILIGASLRNANLFGAHFQQTVFTESDLTGAILDQADMRGAFGLSAWQVCQAQSHNGTLFDDSLAQQIQSQCPSH